MTMAYLLIALDVSTSPPTVKGAGIFSDQHPTAFNPTRWACIEEMHGETFADACDGLRHRVETEKQLAWVLALPTRKGTWTTDRVQVSAVVVVVDAAAGAVVVGPRRSCNRHEDCDAADAAHKVKSDDAVEAAKQTPAHLPAWRYALKALDHCHDSDCEDCFPR